MEEILASIRRIISEDEEAGEGEQPADGETEAASGEAGAEEAAAPSEPVAAGSEAAPEEAAPDQPAAGGEEEDKDEDEDEEDDVLELTREVTEDGDVVDLAEGKEPEAEMTTEAGEQEAAPEESEQEAAPVDENELTLEDAEPGEVEPAAEAAPPPAAGGDDSLVSPPTAAAATDSLEELAKAVAKGEEPGTPHASVAGKSLEGIVTELLRPMLKEWLDQNLPSLTEKLVRKEVERAARRAEEL